MSEEKQIVLARKLNETALSVLGQPALEGFEKAFLLANAAQSLKTLLTKEYMAPIMALQGNGLGFKSDKDKDGGYSEDVVKNCLIEAVLRGVQPFGNQFNIIQSSCYITKEGYGYLLSKIEGLSYEIVSELPRINTTSAAVVMKVNWSIKGGEKKERSLDMPIKVNSFMGTDAILGKATRKARKWLYETVTGNEIPDGDVDDYDAKVVTIKAVEVNHEDVRIRALIDDAKTEDDLIDLLSQVDLDESQTDYYSFKMEQIQAASKNKKK
jgi:hypothetical protein